MLNENKSNENILIPNEQDEIENILLEVNDNYYDNINKKENSDEIDILEISKFKKITISIESFFKKYRKLILKLFFLLLFFSLQLTVLIITLGFALVPSLVKIALSFYDNQGEITKISSIISFSFFILLLIISLISLVLNIINIFHNYKKRKKILQISFIIINFILNLIYSIGCIYCYIKGIKNKNLRKFMDIYLSSKELRKALSHADSYNYKIEKNKSLFWSGLGKDGEDVSNDYAMKNGRKTLSMILKQFEIEEPKDNEGWRALSASFGMKAKGNVVGLIGKSVGQKIPEKDTVIGDIWLHIEKPILGINTNVKKLKLIKNYNEIDSFEDIEKFYGNIGETILSLFSGIFQIFNIFIN